MPLTLVTRTHGRPTTDHPSATPVPAPSRPWLTRLFAGEIELPAVAAAAPCPDVGIPAEALAVGRALACTDLFLLDSADRPTRERLIVELARRAAERGESVLVLSPDPAAVDRLVESLASNRSLRAVRALAEDENPHRPTPAVTRLTSQVLGIGRADQMKREAALAISALEAKLSRFDRSRTVRVQLDTVERERRELGIRLESIAAEVRAEAVAAMRVNCDAALAPLESERAVVAAKRAEKEATLAATRSKRTDGMKRPGLFARLLGRAKPAGDVAELDRTIGVLEGELNDLTQRETKLDTESAAIVNRFAGEAEQPIAETIAARRAAIEPRQRELETEAARLDLTVREFLPQRVTADDTVENGAPNPTTRTDLERELAVARARLEELAQAGSDLARRLLAEAQIVVGTPGSLAADPVFRARTGPFALLVLDHAEELTEADFEHLSARAARWVLAGDAALPEEPRPHLNGNGRHRRGEPALLARLASLLDGEPWAIEGDRLVFRLVHLNAEKRKALSREPVLDNPHVELRVGDGDDPILAEIAFPASTSVVDAKSFLFSQLGEVLLRPCGERQWRRGEERLTVCWPAAETGSGVWVDLDPGVRELVTGAGSAAFTAAIDFERSAGWDEKKAEAWLNEHEPAASASRLAVLPRVEPELAVRSLPV